MNIPYMIYQAERTTTPAEQREVDRRHGELAATLTRPWRRSGRRGRRQPSTQHDRREADTFCDLARADAVGPLHLTQLGAFPRKRGEPPSISRQCA